VDTTERSAQIGGTVATNASGARTLYYGPTRQWVKAITVVTADTRLLHLKRGQVQAREGILKYVDENGASRTLLIPDLSIPRTKHTAGYHLKSDMDALDLFIGSEGTLGVITDVNLKLIPKPANRLFLTLFPEEEMQVLELVRACLGHPGLDLLALEYIGPRALRLLRERGRASGVGMDIARLPGEARTALYAELVFADEGRLDRLYAELQKLLQAAGIDPENSWAGLNERTMDEMKNLRHAVPETVNTIIGERKRRIPELHKVGTDMAVPHHALSAVMQLYRQELEKRQLDYVIFGHIGDGHLHVNILPENRDELDEAKSVYMDFAREVVKLGGSVAAEHGIGRLKKPFLALQHSEAELEAMRQVKRALDPDCVLNPGVLFDMTGAQQAPCQRTDAL
jgi:D-lactate dehydrogenase (cytochrome)